MGKNWIAIGNHRFALGEVDQRCEATVSSLSWVRVANESAQKHYSLVRYKLTAVAFTWIQCLLPPVNMIPNLEMVLSAFYQVDGHSDP